MPKTKPQKTAADQLESLLKAYTLRRLEGAPREKPPKPAKPGPKRPKAR